MQPLLKYLQNETMQDYRMEAFCWLMLGLLFAWLARQRNSGNYGVFAALAINFSLWVLLGHQEATTFLQRPQLWLIPLGLIILVAEYLNRARLGFWPSMTVRYAGLVCIYLSSTIEMLKDGINEYPILPIALAVLAVAGMLLGILFRVRAFLVTGFTALLIVIFAQIWHAVALGIRAGSGGAAASSWVWSFSSCSPSSRNIATR